ncbi:GDSL-type esterase/lipase family protein [Micromonospora sp. NPDC049047]|uniref:GDSL-type esterase/lipase family protein n=1 Tax=Micromonospora sp. NPDC049047 TaxID=3155645 RepID=UPI003407AD88
MRNIGRLLCSLLLMAGFLAVAPTPAQAAVTKMMIVGDSISQGSSGDFTWRFRLHERLATTAPGAVDFVGPKTDLYNNVTNQHGSTAYANPSFDQAHNAFWGRRLSDEKIAISGKVATSGAGVLLVLLGINDLVQGASPSQVAQDMRGFIANARSANPGVDFIIGHTLSRYDIWQSTPENVQDTRQLNVLYDQLAAELNTSNSRVTIASPDFEWYPEYYTWDGTHPNSTGEARIAAAFTDALAGLGIGSPYGSRPSFVQWNSTGNQPSVAPLDSAASLTWASKPGATGYLVEQRNVTLGETAFTRLPYPANGTSFVSKSLAPGARVEFRIVPTKGTMIGRPGTPTAVTVGGPDPSSRPTLTAAPATENSIRLSWSAVPNASGYHIEYLDLTKYRTEPNWIRLPWPIPGTTFTQDVLYPGHWYRFRVVPVNGFNEGTPSLPVEARTKGRPFDRYKKINSLGDSYSSGLGAGGQGGYTGGNCKRTTNAWPYFVAPFDRSSFDHQACSGATIPSLRAGQLSTVFHNPGEEGLVTLTIGGNDVGFGNSLQTCLTQTSSCAGLEPSIADKIDNLKPSLVSLYSDIRTQVPGADIVVAGYPLLIEPPGSGDCNLFVNLQLKDDEKYMILRLGARLNAVIKDAARTAGVMEAVDETVAQFDGHAACSTNGEYINQTAAGALPYDASGSFHPKSSGQTAYSIAVNNRLTTLFNGGWTRR